MPSAQTPRSPRRWIPLAALAVAFGMTFTVFPNPLRVPTNNPGATAELAPVPGRPQTSQQANFSETNIATSGGIGAGGTSGGGGLPELPPLKGRVVPIQKNCVGDPPRQTEDPLSPPCVPFFDGDNGGRTFTGVTRNEIGVVFYNDSGIQGDMSTPYKPSDEVCTGAAPYECENIVRTIKAHIRYFQRRYQTYGRRVHVIAQPTSGGRTTTPEQQRQDALLTISQFDPFAVVSFLEGGENYFAKLSELGIPTFGLNFNIKRNFFERHAPFIWSFMPDQETESQLSAAFLCRKLKGLPARFSVDPNLNTRTRKFGFIWGRNSQRGPEREEVARLFRSEASKQCGLKFVEATFDESAGAGAGGREASSIMAMMKLENVTTLVCYCLPLQPEFTVATMKNAASSINYFPEWYWDGQGSYMDDALWQQTLGKGDDRQRSLGSSYWWRQPAFRQQYHYQAYLTEEPGTVPNVRFNFLIYHLFLNLFTAIQAAGPRLTPQTVEQGMFTFKNPDVKNPWIPAGGYGADGPGTYTFDDTAMGWWWDPAGTPPGGREGEGCIRVIQGGRRFYWNQWTRGDSDLFRPTDPCTEVTRKISDPQTSGPQ